MKKKRVLVTLFIVACFTMAFSRGKTDTLRVAYTPAAPFVIAENELLEGINLWLWQRVAEDLHLEYTLEPMEFSSMLNALKRGEIDVSINPLTITGERSREMEFTHSFFASHSTIAITEKSSLEKVKQFFGAFFHINFLRGFVLLFVILLFFGSLTWLAEHKRNPNDFRPGIRGVWDGLWWAMVTLSTVGYGDKSPKSRLGKIAALGLMFCGLLFVSGLTASIASSLTVDQLESSQGDFNTYKKRKVGTVKDSEAESFLQARFFKDISTYDRVLPGLMDLEKSKLDAFIYDEPILRYIIQKNTDLHTLDILPQKFDVQFYAFGIRKDAISLEQQISQRILEITESQEWQIVLSEYGLSEF
ncbi:Extracellular solute-binding protein, family 3 [Croceitalea dokdonensis DOKDO 023]|uniref:Extracellular solute-binding protein, family 3 n=1 Tax=Croceitalea dokdonensis DOKDO 023 TaxID=1300341 RepID=A0A0P7AIT6_9FLAO|nr:transporter substrate-binding domain-containing protein [Croceitalea dokdonensis]KPM33513.1 Extracellular solute-binding protein, family 3 [Croceitalea dokdonensis DOKDO 023]